MIARRRFAIGLLLILGMGVPGYPARAQSEGPPDEATREPALVEARRRFIEALERRDEAALRASLHEKVGVGNGGDGPQDVIDLLRERPEFVADYVAILKLGGRFAEPGLFMAPFTAKPSYAPEDDSRLFAARPDVVLRTEPRGDAPVARPLGYAVVEAKFDEDEMKRGWIKIVGPAGYAGYVSIHEVYLVGGIFIHFRKEGDRWLVVRFY